MSIDELIQNLQRIRKFSGENINVYFHDGGENLSIEEVSIKEIQHSIQGSGDNMDVDVEYEWAVVLE